MIGNVSHADWIAAQHELQAIRRRARMVNEPDIEKILGGIYRTLVAERQPLVAACELEFVAELLPRYPHLQRSLLRIARWIYENPRAGKSMQ